MFSVTLRKHGNCHQFLKTAKHSSEKSHLYPIGQFSPPKLIMALTQNHSPEVCDEQAEQAKQTTTWLYSDRTPCGDRDHCSSGFTAAACSATGQRSGRRWQCINNLKQIGLAEHNAEGAFGKLAKSIYEGQYGITAVSPYPNLANYLEQANLVQELQSRCEAESAFSFDSLDTTSVPPLSVAICPSMVDPEVCWSVYNYPVDFSSPADPVTRAALRSDYTRCAGSATVITSIADLNSLPPGMGLAATNGYGVG